VRIVEAVYESLDFAGCFAIRWEVFVGEQRVPPDDEQDALDETARHFLLFVGDEPAATARAVACAPGVVKIGRVAVRKPFRRGGVGAALMRGVEAAHPGAAFVLDAQLQALRFYETLGYVAEGPEFLDSGIPHRRMLKPAS
jgi:predicted GNAT family N-acyltransferase